MKKCVLLLTVHMSVSLSVKLSQQRFVLNVTIIITVDYYYEKKRHSFSINGLKKVLKSLRSNLFKAIVKYFGS